MWHPKALSKGHVDVVTGEWVAVCNVCVCVCVCVCVGGQRERESVFICASMEEAAVGIREMS